MPFVDGDIIRIVCKMSYGEDDIQNVWHCQISGGTLPSYSSFVTGMNTKVGDLYDNITADIPIDISFDSVDYYNVTQDEFIGTSAWSGITTGLASPGSMPPPQCSPLIKFASTVLRSIGKKFLPAFDTARIDADGSINATGLTSMTNMIVDILAGMGVSGDYWCYFGNWSPELLRFAAWTTGIVRDLFATQRRRYVGSGT